MCPSAPSRALPARVQQVGAVADVRGSRAGRRSRARRARRRRRRAGPRRSASPCPIAFSKIDGFDVTPEMPSSTIRRSSAPLSISWREMLSSQIDWPWASISCRWFVMSVSFWSSEGRLEGEHLVESALVALGARERSSRGSGRSARARARRRSRARRGRSRWRRRPPWLCRALNESWQTAARTPRTLFAAIAAPAPDPHRSTPASARPLVDRVAALGRAIGVVVRRVGVVDARGRATSCPPLAQMLDHAAAHAAPLRDRRRLRRASLSPPAGARARRPRRPAT